MNTIAPNAIKILSAWFSGTNNLTALPAIAKKCSGTNNLTALPAIAKK